MNDFARRKLLSGMLVLGGGIVAAPGALANALGQEAIRPRNLRDDLRFTHSPFTLGIASGDPAADGFVIWTRLAPKPMVPGGGMPMAPVPVRWEVATDERFRTIAAAGDALAHPELAHSVHVEVVGLSPDRPYWYRFTCGGQRSRVGRSRTFPLPGAAADRVRFAVAGCQNIEGGYFGAWRDIAEGQLDFVYHYGDYIYEGAGNPEGPLDPSRALDGKEIYSLDDYRRRYALYKADADLQAAHASAPFFVAFDDHEVDNNWARDIDQDDTPPELFRMRRAMAMQAYYEHMPLRRSSLPQGSQIQIFRSASFGSLLDTFVLDTRQYRDNQLGHDRDSVPGPGVFVPERTLLGERQEKWLFNKLSSSAARWNLLAQQVMMMGIIRRLEPTSEPICSMDTWTGYRAARQRLLAHIRDRAHKNVIVVGGDAHRHFAGDLIADDSDAPVAGEYHVTSISSGGDGRLEDDDYVRSLRRGGNDFLRTTINKRGYLLCDVTRDQWRGELKVIDRVRQRGGTVNTAAVYVTEAGRPGLQNA